MANETNRADASAAATGVDEAKPQGSAKAQGGESLDKVRDILFGSQAREYEKRFIRLEERLLKEASDLRDELRKRFDTLESYTRKEVESLAARLKAEHEQRTESARDISRHLDETSGALERKTSELDEHLIATQRELREQILDQSKSISDEIRQKHEATAAAMERATAELRDEKTDRAALASLFMEVAMRLNNEFKIPEGEDLE
jgi:DNA anti-recombination protein RmuC